MDRPFAEETLFAALYHRHYRAIRDFCRRRVPKDVVDDVVAETFLTAWRASTMSLAGIRSALAVRSRLPRDRSPLARRARRRRLEDRMQVINGGAASAADDAVVAADQRRLVLDARRASRDRRRGAPAGGMGTTVDRRNRRSARHRAQRCQATSPPRQATPRARIPQARVRIATSVDPRSSERSVR